MHRDLGLLLAHPEIEHLRHAFGSEFYDVLLFFLGHEMAHWRLKPSDGGVATDQPKHPECSPVFEEVRADLLAAETVSEVKLYARMTKDTSLVQHFDTNLWSKVAAELGLPRTGPTNRLDHPYRDQRVLATGLGFMAGLRYFCLTQTPKGQRETALLMRLLEVYERQTPTPELLPQVGPSDATEASPLLWSARVARLILARDSNAKEDR